MLRDQVEGQREVAGEGETVREVLEDVIARYPALRANLFEQDDLSPFVNVYVGRDDVRTLEGLDTPVGGSSVILLPAMAGGGRNCGTRRRRLLSWHRERAQARKHL
jgi:molybdopterin synthase sulfur carrier subunit